MFEFFDLVEQVAGALHRFAGPQVVIAAPQKVNALENNVDGGGVEQGVS